MILRPGLCIDRPHFSVWDLSRSQLVYRRLGGVGPIPSTLIVHEN